MTSPEDLWVFGYGSLMWRPGFEFSLACPAKIYGFHRSLCVYSHVHRGTRHNPGLVFGLDRGGSCRGMAFRVAGDNAGSTLEYLRKREQVTSVYIEHNSKIYFADPNHAPSLGVTYIVDRSHEQYAGQLSLNEQFRLVSSSHGQSGPNRDYIISTSQHLEQLGIVDQDIQALANKLTGS